MSLAMTKQEREAFLADLHVGVISIEEAGRGPLTVPIWYDYEPGGELWILTDRASRKGKALDAADPERVGRPMAHRYLGKELGDQYLEATSADEASRESVCFRMRPEHWLTVDYAKQFSQV